MIDAPRFGTRQQFLDCIPRPDDTYLSTEYGRDTVTVGFLQNAQLDYEEYFEDLESLAREYDGRPHWGKRHTLRADELAELYPKFDAFQVVRREMDPDGIFLTDYLQELFGVGESTQAANRDELTEGAP